MVSSYFSMLIVNNFSIHSLNLSELKRTYIKSTQSVLSHIEVYMVGSYADYFFLCRLRAINFWHQFLCF